MLQTYGTTTDDTPVQDAPATDEDDGLSTGEKVAIGVGVAAGAAAVGAAGYAIYEHYHKDDDEAAAAVTPAAAAKDSEDVEVAYPSDSTAYDKPAEEEAPPKKSGWF